MLLLFLIPRFLHFRAFTFVTSLLCLLYTYGNFLSLLCLIMTVERSKRRFLIPLVFITKCFKKPLLLSMFFYFVLIDLKFKKIRSQELPQGID